MACGSCGLPRWKRGAIHHHVLVWTPDPIDVLEVQRLALAAGYGCVLDLAPIVPGSRRHAYYVSKYVTKSIDKRDSVPWAVDVVDERTGEIRKVRKPPRRRPYLCAAQSPAGTSSASTMAYAYPCSARKRWRWAAYSWSRVSRATTE